MRSFRDTANGRSWLPSLLMVAAGFAAACTGPSSGDAAPGGGKMASDPGHAFPGVVVSTEDPAGGPAPRISDPLTGEMLTPPVAGAQLLPTDPTAPGAKNWRGPDGQLYLTPPPSRGQCVSRTPDGTLVAGDCALPLPSSLGSVRP